MMTDIWLFFRSRYRRWRAFKQELKQHRPVIFGVVDLVETLISALAIALVIKTFFIQTSRIPTGSMIPTLNAPSALGVYQTNHPIDKAVQFLLRGTPGDWLLVNKMIYRFRSPRRGEIVVFKSPVKGSKLEWVKRCIGLPGEKVEVKKGLVYINDRLLVLPGVDIQRDYSSFGPMVVPADCFFVLGDNRAHSNDARRWAQLPNIGRSYIRKDELVGKAFFTFFPLSRMRVLR